MDARSGAAACAWTHLAISIIHTSHDMQQEYKHTAHLYEPAARLRGAPTRVLYIYGSVQAHFFSHFPAVAHIREDIKMAVSSNHRAGRKMSSEPPMNGVQKGR